jgi:hypothetical protein
MVVGEPSGEIGELVDITDAINPELKVDRMMAEIAKLQAQLRELSEERRQLKVYIFISVYHVNYVYISACNSSLALCPCVYVCFGAFFFFF